MTPSPDNLRVLIVEDEPRYRNLLEREVVAMGHRASACERAEEALALLDTETFDAAILDLNLPGMSGMEFLEQVRESQPEVAVIINTAYGDMPTAVQALRLEAVDFLPKPCGLDDIERALFKAAQVVERRRGEAAEPFPAPQPEPVETEAPPTSDDAATHAEHEGPLADVERDHILAVLSRHKGHKPAAAEELGISLRTLYNKINLYRQQGVRVPGEEKK